MLRETVLLTSLAFLGWTPITAQDGIVVIRSDLGQERAGIGTGFFISPRGRILTAYHVIQGARQLTVSNHSTLYSDVIVERISPERDLAILVVGPLHAPTPYLQLASVLPNGVENETLRIIGHPDGNLYQRLDTRMTAAGFSKSGTILVGGQQPIFRLADVDMIRIAGIVRNGMSGAPVVSSGGVIGVLSGSTDQGGTLAWAIPAKYVQDPSMRPINKRVRDIRQWDELTLMISRWKNLRYSVKLDDQLQTALNNFFDAVERARVGYENTAEAVEKSVATVRIARSLAEQRRTPAGKFESQDSVVLNLLQERLLAVAQAGNEWLNARSRAMSQLIELELLISGRQGGLPSTPRNDSLAAYFGERLARLERRLTAADSAQQGTLAGLSQRVVALLPAIATLRDTPKDVASTLANLEPILVGMADENARRAIGAESHTLGEAGAFIEEMLTADYDDVTQDWLWRSSLGYSLTIPSGFEQVGGAAAVEAVNVDSAMRAEGFTLDAIFGRKFGEPSDTANGAAMLVVGRSLAPVPRSAFNSISAQAEQPAKLTGMEFERLHRSDIDAFITRGVVINGNRRTLRCVAVVFGPTRPILIAITSPPSHHEYLHRCKSLVESATF